MHHLHNTSTCRLARRPAHAHDHSCYHSCHMSKEQWLVAFSRASVAAATYCSWRSVCNWRQLLCPTTAEDARGSAREPVRVIARCIAAMVMKTWEQVIGHRLAEGGKQGAIACNATLLHHILAQISTSQTMKANPS